MMRIVVAGSLWHRCSWAHITLCNLAVHGGFEILLSAENPRAALELAQGIGAHFAPETADCKPCPTCFPPDN